MKMYIQAAPHSTQWAENVVQARGIEDFTHTHTYNSETQWVSALWLLCVSLIGWLVILKGDSYVPIQA